MCQTQIHYLLAPLTLTALSTPPTLFTLFDMIDIFFFFFNLTALFE